MSVSERKTKVLHHSGNSDIEYEFRIGLTLIEIMYKHVKSKAS